MPNQYSQSRVNRLKAIENGEKKYISETHCEKCGSYERYVSNNSCAPCAIKSGLEKLNNKDLMEPYRTKEKTKKKDWIDGENKIQKSGKNKIKDIQKKIMLRQQKEEQQ